MKFLLLFITLMATPAEANEYMDLAFKNVADSVGVPEKLLRSVCWAESSFRVNAYNHRDGATDNHAFGVCQVLYKTAKDYGLNDDKCLESFKDRPKDRGYKHCKLFGIHTSIYFGALYLKFQLERYEGDYKLAVAAYNSGTAKKCRTGEVRRRRDNKLLFKCKIGELMNQKHVDRVLNHFKGH